MNDFRRRVAELLNLFGRTTESTKHEKKYAGARVRYIVDGKNLLLEQILLLHVGGILIVWASQILNTLKIRLTLHA